MVLAIVSTDSFYGNGYDTGRIEHALPPVVFDEDGNAMFDLVEGVDYEVHDVCQADGTMKSTIIRRPRP